MVNSIRWVMPAGVVLWLCVAPAVAQTPDANEPNAEKEKSLFSRFNFFAQKKPPAPKLTPREKEDAMKAQLHAEAIAKAKTSSLLRQKEQETFHRRQAVCDKLLAIARQTNDHKLERMAEQLMDMAWEAYCRKTSSSGANSDQSLDQSILRSQLSAGADTPAAGPGANGQFAARKEQ